MADGCGGAAHAISGEGCGGHRCWERAGTDECGNAHAHVVVPAHGITVAHRDDDRVRLRRSWGVRAGGLALMLLVAHAGGWGGRDAGTATLEQAARSGLMAKALEHAFVARIESRLEDAQRTKRTHRAASVIHSSVTAQAQTEQRGTRRAAEAHAKLALQTLAGSAARGRSGDDNGDADPDDPSPGFEPPVGRAPLDSKDVTGVDPGMRGEDTPFIKAADTVLQALGEITGDREVRVPSHPVKETATLRWLPFGRDEVIAQPPAKKEGAHFVADRDETYREFPDDVEPDSEAAAFRGTDVQVPQPSAGAKLEPPELDKEAAEEAAGGSVAGGHWGAAFGLHDFMDDQYDVQVSQTAKPRSHRAHTDFDIQGLLPDVAVPGSEYLPGLGEDSRPYGVVDDNLKVPPPAKASAPKLGDAGTAPETWGDVDVKEGVVPRSASAPNLDKDVALAGRDARALDLPAVATDLGNIAYDVTHGDESGGGAFGDTSVTPSGADAAAAQIDGHAPLLAAMGPPKPLGDTS